MLLFPHILGRERERHASQIWSATAFAPDGTAMQLIARKDDAGNVRLAFNTCQSCGGSPYAWFEDLGDGTLQCQNCGLIFQLDTVGAEAAQGCNPVTITDYTVDGDTVTVSDAVLKANVERFANWKKFD